MTDESIRAQADQALAATGKGLDVLVEIARSELGAIDRTNIVASTYASLLLGSAVVGSAELLKGLALAIVRLAEAPGPCTNCPQCAQSALAAALLEA
jgi:hypothetical protein